MARKAIPIFLILLGIALFSGAILFAVDKATSPEAEGLGTWIFTVLGLLLGASSGIKGWLDWNKNDTSPHTMKINVDGDSQINTGAHGRNIRQGDNSQYIENYHEAPKKEIIFSLLHQLPQYPKDFKGREQLIDLLIADLKNSKGTTINGLTGMGGIGKTALGLVVAHKISEDYPDAQIFLDLKGTTSPLSTIDIMRHAILSFEPRLDLRMIDQANISAVYQSVLHGKRVLLFFDNAKSAEQIAPLQPPNTCAMLITSRWFFSVPGLQTHRLNLMNEGDAKDFLLDICPRIGNKAAELAKACAYLPLALRIAGSFLQVNNDWDVEKYIVQLNDHKHRLAILKQSHEGAELMAEQDLLATFELSYNLLREEDQMRWRMLGVFPATFPSFAASSMWNLDEDTAKKLLSSLRRYNMLDYDETSSRYYMHDLLRDFAISKMEENEENQNRYKHAKHYLGLLKYVDNQYSQGHDKVLRSLQVLDTEWRNIIAAYLWVKQNSHVANVLELTMEFPNAGYRIIGLRLHPRDYVDWLTIGIDAAQKLNNQEYEIAYLNNLSNQLLFLGDAETAIKYYEEVLKTAQSTENNKLISVALSNLGLTYEYLGEAKKAFKCFEESLLIVQESGDSSEKAEALKQLGTLCRETGDIKKAIELHQEALEIVRRKGDRKEEAEIIDSLGVDHDHLGDTNQAVAYSLAALEIVQEISYRNMEGKILNNLGVFHGKLGQTYKAIDYFKQQLDIAREFEDSRSECSVLGNLGIAYDHLGDIDKAIEYHEQNLSLARRVSYRRSEAAALVNLGATYGKLGQVDQCIQYFQQALPILEALDSPHAFVIKAKLRELGV